MLSKIVRRSDARLLTIVVAAAFALLAQPARAQADHPWTVQEIFGHPGSLTGDPPDNISWSPDGKIASWIDENGDLVAIQPPDSKPKKLIPYGKISVLLNAAMPERDRDHRARYDEPDYIWAPDSQHFLFDTNGALWLFTPQNGTGVQIGNSGMMSGDDPKFSPNGQFVSYLHDGNLWVQRPDGTAPPLELTTTHDDTLLNGVVDWVYLEELDARSNYFWSPDSREVAYLQTNEASVPQYPLVDWIPVHANVELQRYPQPGDPNPGVRVGIVGAGGGNTRWLKIPMEVGSDYIPRFGWVNPHVVWVEVLSRNHQRLDLWFADTHTGDIRRVLQQYDPKYLNLTYDVKFVGDHQFLILSWRDGHTHIYRYTFNPNNPFGDLAQLANQVESGDYEVASVKGVDENAQTLWFLSNEGDSRQQQVWAVQFDGGGKHPVTQNTGFHDVSFPAQGGSFIDTWSQELAPPVVSACTPAGSCSVLWRSKPIEGHHLIASQPLVLTAADKVTKLYGTLLLPPGDDAPHSIPLIVNPYGGPGAASVRDRWGAKHFLFDQVLAEHGFAVLHVDNRGMAGRGRDFEQVAYHNFGPPSSPIRWPPSIRSSAIIPSSIRTASAGGAGAGAAALPSSRFPTATVFSPVSPVLPSPTGATTIPSIPSATSACPPTTRRTTTTIPTSTVPPTSRVTSSSCTAPATTMSTSRTTRSTSRSSSRPEFPTTTTSIPAKPTPSPALTIRPSSTARSSRISSCI